jgi:hypothetical protein
MRSLEKVDPLENPNTSKAYDEQKQHLSQTEHDAIFDSTFKAPFDELSIIL